MAERDLFDRDVILGPWSPGSIPSPELVAIEVNQRLGDTRYALEQHREEVHCLAAEKARIDGRLSRLKEEGPLVAAPETKPVEASSTKADDLLMLVREMDARLTTLEKIR